MDLKISTLVAECRSLNPASVQDTATPAVEGGAAPPSSCAPAARLDLVAEAVLDGRIGRQEAVEAVLSEALSSPVSRAIPPENRRELAELLEAMLSEDPYLRSLACAISAS